MPQAFFDGLCIILPRIPGRAGESGGGGLEAMLGLPADVMERLISQALFRSNAEMLIA